MLKSEELNIYKSPSTDQILEERVQAGGNNLSSEIQKLTNSIMNKKELLNQMNESIIMPIYITVIKLIVVTLQDYQCYQLYTQIYPVVFSQF
jgi:hypothetical protein